MNDEKACAYGCTCWVVVVEVRKGKKAKKLVLGGLGASVSEATISGVATLKPEPSPPYGSIVPRSRATGG